MDYNKIAEFIISERKRKKLTQAKLAENIFISEKTISKWENGKGLPDADSLVKLSQIFDCTINEILNGERFQTEEYISKAENKLIEIQKEKEESIKRLLWSEVVIGCVSLVFFLTLLFVSIYLFDAFGLIVISNIIGIFGFVQLIACVLFCLYIEQKAGYYMCSKCNHKYEPLFWQVCLARHIGRSRYMKCPKCHKKS